MGSAISAQMPQQAAAPGEPAAQGPPPPAWASLPPAYLQRVFARLQEPGAPQEPFSQKDRLRCRLVCRSWLAVPVERVRVCLPAAGSPLPMLRRAGAGLRELMVTDMASGEPASASTARQVLSTAHAAAASCPNLRSLSLAAEHAGGAELLAPALRLARLQRLELFTPPCCDASPAARLPELQSLVLWGDSGSAVRFLPGAPLPRLHELVVRQAAPVVLACGWEHLEGLTALHLERSVFSIEYPLRTGAFAGGLRQLSLIDCSSAPTSALHPLSALELCDMPTASLLHLFRSFATLEAITCRQAILPAFCDPTILPWRDMRRLRRLTISLPPTPEFHPRTTVLALQAGLHIGRALPSCAVTFSVDA